MLSTQANLQGYVWQDNDQNSKYSANIDSGFEGIVVNLYRAVGSALTFLGCENTDGTGSPDLLIYEVSVRFQHAALCSVDASLWQSKAFSINWWFAKPRLRLATEF
jgi:hypothetical protein